MEVSVARTSLLCSESLLQVLDLFNFRWYHFALLFCARLQASFAFRARRLPSAALRATWGSSLDYVPRAAASLGPNSGAWSSARAPVGCSWGPSEARCAPLVRLLLLSDPGSWCSGTRKHLRHLPGLFLRGGVAGHEQSGAWSSTRAPVGSWGLGPSEARCAPSGAAAATLWPRFLVQLH